MNKYVVGLLVGVVLLQVAGCRRRHIDRPGATTAKTDSAKYQHPVTPPLVKPADTVSITRPSWPGLPRPGIEEARANVAEIDFTYLKAKSKLSFKSKTQDIDNATVNLRVRKDSLIWLSVSKLGIEVARALITRDSITVLDVFHKTYLVYDFPALSRQFNFEMNFDLLQALIVGNLPLPKRPAQKIKNERDYLLLRQSEGKVLVENYIGEQDRKLKKLMVTEQPTKNTLRLDYEDFSTLNNFLFPYTSLVTVDYQSKTDGQFYQTLLTIKHSKVELLEKSPGFPFTISSKYKRQ